MNQTRVPWIKVHAALLVLVPAAACLAILCLTTLSSATIHLGDGATESVSDFELRDYRGKLHALSDYADQKLVVVAVMGTECPLAKLYAPRLERISQDYLGKGVIFLGLNANQQDSMAEVAAHARIHKITFPVLKDPLNEVADLFGAERTPQVFVLDEERRIRYQGRIDDQYGVGFVRAEPEVQDLRNALEELLAGKNVSVPKTEAVGCLLGREPRVEPHGDVTYTGQIARILQNNCVDCHREGQIAPFPLTSYQEVAGWADMMCEVVREQRMPPWNANSEFGHFSNDSRLSVEDRQLLYEWVANGCPEGDPADLPEPREFTAGWRIPEPDRVIAMKAQPFDVPAEGVVEYMHFTVDPKFEEDVWIRAAEARPGNRAVVHHILVLIKDPKSRRRGLNVLVGFAPGTPPRQYPFGAAKRVPAGSELVFQLHYTPNGSPQQDLSSVGLIFARPEEVKQEVVGGMAMNGRFKIPANADNHRVISSHQFRRDELLVAMSPHMHLRGKAFRFEVEYPDGRQEVLLDVPRYDFNWQLRYELAQPKWMPSGTRLTCTAHFDNSKHNLNNPAPQEEVTWGDQTWEEMMIGWYTSYVDRTERK